MRPTQFSTTPTTTADMTMRMIPGIGLPVWAVFLMAYPPFCAILFGITYVAFRYRWWRAGGT